MLNAIICSHLAMAKLSRNGMVYLLLLPLFQTAAGSILRIVHQPNEFSLLLILLRSSLMVRQEVIRVNLALAFALGIIVV